MPQSHDVTWRYLTINLSAEDIKDSWQYSVAPTVEQRTQFGKHAGNRTKQINTTINPSGTTQQHTQPDRRGMAGRVEWEGDERGGRGERTERKTPKRSAWHVPLSLFPRRRRRRNLTYFSSVSKKCKVGFGYPGEGAGGRVGVRDVAKEEHKKEKESSTARSSVSFSLKKETEEPPSLICLCRFDVV